MQSVSSRIWTRVAVSISHDDNDYTTGTSLSRMVMTLTDMNGILPRTLTSRSCTMRAWRDRNLPFRESSRCVSPTTSIGVTYHRLGTRFVWMAVWKLPLCKTLFDQVNFSCWVECSFQWVMLVESIKMSTSVSRRNRWCFIVGYAQWKFGKLFNDVFNRVFLIDGCY